MLPFEGECTPNHSLFDSAGAAMASQGTGNVAGDVSSFFVDRIGRDFRPAKNSPALGLGQPGLVTDDLDGNARPLPAGSQPDSGALESPR